MKRLSLSLASPLAPRLLPLAAALLVAGATTAQADAVGFRLGAYAWQPDYDGTVRADGDKVDLNDDLGLDDDNASVVYIAIEHPIPALPNVRLQHTSLDTSATQALSRMFIFDGVVYTAADTVHTDLDLSHTDLTLYYEVLDNWVELDLGLTVRQFEEGVKLTAVNDGSSSEAEIDGTVPMFYLAAKFNLPLTGAYVALDGNGIGYSGNTLFDYRALVGYESPIGLGVEIGIRSFDLDYDDDGDAADVTVRGGYASAFYHF